MITNTFLDIPDKTRRSTHIKPFDYKNRFEILIHYKWFTRGNKNISLNECAMYKEFIYRHFFSLVHEHILRETRRGLFQDFGFVFEVFDGSAERPLDIARITNDQIRPRKDTREVGMWYILKVHDDVIKWKHFPRYWPFVWGIHRSPVNSPHKWPVSRSLDDFFDLSLNKRLSKQSRRMWFETPSLRLWCHCNVFNRACEWLGLSLNGYVNIAVFISNHQTTDIC